MKPLSLTKTRWTVTACTVPVIKTVWQKYKPAASPHFIAGFVNMNVDSEVKDILGLKTRERGNSHTLGLNTHFAWWPGVIPRQTPKGKGTVAQTDSTGNHPITSLWSLAKCLHFKYKQVRKTRSPGVRAAGGGGCLKISKCPPPILMFFFSCSCFEQFYISVTHFVEKFPAVQTRSSQQCLPSF